MKQENLEEMVCLASLDSLDHQVTLALAQREKKDSRGFQVLRDVLVALVSLALAMMESPAFVENLEIPVYLACQGHLVYLDRKDKVYLA